MIFTVDRIEGGIAVCLSDGGELREIPLSSVSYELSEGDVFEIPDGDGKSVIRRDDEKRARTAKNKNLFDKLKNRGKKQ